MAQIKSRTSGLWDNPKTWVGGKLPQPGDHVLIRSGHTVTPTATTTFSGGQVQIEDGAMFDTTKINLTLGLRGLSGGGVSPSSGGGGGSGVRQEK